MKNRTIFNYTFICIIFSCLSACTSISKTEFDYGDTPPDLTDTDNDGVINERDICPETPEKTVVSYDGCSFWSDLENVKEAVVFFDTGSSKVRFEHIEDIENIVEHVKEVPDARIFIEGYTSKIGNKKDNDILQRARSESVKRLLLQEGASPDSIFIHEQGEKTQYIEKNEISSIAVNQRAYIHAVKPEKNLQIKWSVYGGKGNELQNRQKNGNKGDANGWNIYGNSIKN
jgi:outer membrane protein OmpA-like peptidoglycan-associated protein